MELYPSLPIILGVMGGIVIVFAAFVIVLVAKRPGRNSLKSVINQEDSRMHILKKDDSNSGRHEGDERDPDVIPESRGSRVDCNSDHHHSPPVADVSTLYGEMMTQQGGNSAPSQTQQPGHQGHPATNAHIHTEPSGANNQPNLVATASQQQQQMQNNNVQQQMLANQQQQHSMTPQQSQGSQVTDQVNPQQVHLAMSVHSPSLVGSPQIISPSIMSIPVSSSCSTPDPNSLPTQINGNFQNTSNNQIFFQNLPPQDESNRGPLQQHQVMQQHPNRLQHTQSLQNSQLEQQQQLQKLHHQQSLPERNYFSPSPAAYANAHLLTKNKASSTSHTLHSPHTHKHNVLNQHHQHHHHPQSNHNQSQHQHQEHQPQQQNHHHQKQHLQQQQQHHQHQQHQQQMKQHSGSRSSLLSSMGPGSTQTLPHPRSQHGRSGQAVATVNTATLGRRGSLYIDPLTTPIAPPPSYATPPPYSTGGTPPASLVESSDGTLVVAETICITPNYVHNHSNHAHSNVSQPDDGFSSSKPFPSSFSTDRMESAV